MNSAQRRDWNWSVYNPTQLERSEMIERFLVADRQHTLREVVEFIIKAPHPSVPHHVLLTGPRGSGKTTLLLRIKYYVEDTKELAAAWLPLLFAEEQDHIGDLSDFLLGTLRQLGPQYAAQADDLLASAAPEEDLTDVVLASLAEHSQKYGKRLLLLIDNLDAVVEALPSHQLRAFRSLLAKETHMLFIGTIAHHHTKDILSNTLGAEFRRFRLQELSPVDFTALLRNMALLSRNDSLLTTLLKYPNRPAEIYQLTGGNIRTAVLIYRLLSESPTGQLSILPALERMLDDVTPLYQSRTKMLPQQQRRVFAAVAEYWHPVDAATLGKKLRLKANVVSAQLGRLIEDEYVERVEEGKRPKYRVAERLYNVYWLMRNTGPGRRNLELLIGLLEKLSDQETIHTLVQRLLEDGVSQKVQTWRESLRDLYYVAGIMNHSHEPAMRMRLLLGVLDLLKRQRTNPERRSIKVKLQLPDDILNDLSDSSLISLEPEEYSKLITRLENYLKKNPVASEIWHFLATLYYYSDRLPEALQAALHALKHNNGSAPIHLLLARIYDYLNLKQNNTAHLKSALDHSRQAMQIDPDSSESYSLFALLSARAPVELFDSEQSMIAVRHAAELSPSNVEYLRRYSLQLFEEDRGEEALRVIEQALSCSPIDPLTIALKGTIQFTLQNPRGDFKRDNPQIWDLMRFFFYHLIDLYRQTQSTGEGHYIENPFMQMAAIYLKADQLAPAEEAIRRAMLDAPTEPKLLFNYALILGRQDKWPQALLAADAMLTYGSGEARQFLSEFQLGILGFFLLASARGRAAMALDLLTKYETQFPLARPDSPLRVAVEARQQGLTSPGRQVAEEVRIVAESLLRFMDRASEQPIPEPIAGLAVPVDTKIVGRRKAQGS